MDVALFTKKRKKKLHVGFASAEGEIETEEKLVANPSSTLAQKL